jgi:hypothetical protein
MMLDEPDGVHAELVAEPAFIEQFADEIGVAPGVEIVGEQDVSKSHRDTIERRAAASFASGGPPQTEMAGGSAPAAHLT